MSRLRLKEEEVVLGWGEDWAPDMRGRALCIIGILANTAPEDWCTKTKLHEHLAEFRTKPKGPAPPERLLQPPTQGSAE